MQFSGLSSYIAAAEAWCLDQGAAFLGELLDEFEDFCDGFGPVAILSLAQRGHLRQVLLACKEEGFGMSATAPLVRSKLPKLEMANTYPASNTLSLTGAMQQLHGLPYGLEKRFCLQGKRCPGKQDPALPHGQFHRTVVHVSSW